MTKRRPTTWRLNTSYTSWPACWVQVQSMDLIRL